MAVTKENDQAPVSEGLSETERLREELRRERDLRFRALADFDNFRKRIEGERAAAAQRGKRDIVLELLDLSDSFDRAFQQAGAAPASWVEGFRSIHRNLLGLLEAQGVTPFTSLGDPFDPERHEAIGDVENEQLEPGTVAEEVQRGYRWGDELLRPARVRVAR
jgi:molecular chaperone GrpE